MLAKRQSLNVPKTLIKNSARSVASSTSCVRVHARPLHMPPPINSAMLVSFSEKRKRWKLSNAPLFQRPRRVSLVSLNSFLCQLNTMPTLLTLRYSSLFTCCSSANLRQQFNSLRRRPTKLHVCNILSIGVIVFTKVSYCQDSPLDNILTTC